MNGLGPDFLIQQSDALSVNFHSGLDASLVSVVPIVDLSLQLFFDDNETILQTRESLQKSSSVEGAVRDLHRLFPHRSLFLSLLFFSSFHQLA